MKPSEQFPDLMLLEKGETITKGDLMISKGAKTYPIPVFGPDLIVEESDLNNYYRRLEPKRMKFKTACKLFIASLLLLWACIAGFLFSLTIR